MIKIVLFSILLLLGGCGSVSPTGDQSTAGDDTTQSASHYRTTPDPVTDETPGLITAGESQQVLEQKPVYLYASILDRSVTFSGYIWKEGDQVLAEGKEVVLDQLSPGLHQIVLEAIGSDGSIYTDTITVEVRAEPENDALPQASALRFTTPEDTPFIASLRGSDADGDPLRYLLVALPEHGTLSGSAAHLVYTPDPDFYGEDRFVFKTNDGKIDSQPATVTIQVQARNDAPVVENIAVQTPQDSVAEIQPRGSDAEGDRLSYQLVSMPSSGQVSIENGLFVYVPDTGFAGETSFQYRASDGQLDSNIATVTVTVTPVNHLPVISDQTFEMLEDGELDVQFATTDIDGDPLRYDIVRSAALAEAWFDANGTFHYRPNPDVSGVDTIQYRINDTHADTQIATITVNILAQNDAPVAMDDQIETDEAKELYYTLQVNDIDSTDFTYTVVENPQHGMLFLDGASVRYLPDNGFYGNDFFRFKANDGASDSNIATVEIVVHNINDAPQGWDQSISVVEDNSTQIILGGSDSDGDALRYSYTMPLHGTLTGTPPTLLYTPYAGYTGSDTFNYWLNDGTVDSPRYTVSIEVTQKPNSKPVATDINISLQEDQNRTFTLQATDTDNQPLSYRIIKQPGYGTLVQNGATVTYQPQADYYGTDSFSYVASDGTDDSDEATVSVEIAPVNDMPVAYSAPYALYEDENLSITLQGSDTEDSSLTYTIVSYPQYGQLSCNGVLCTYIPQSDYSGTDTFSFTVEDTEGGVSDPAVISLTILSRNDAPVAQADMLQLLEDQNITITLEASDPDSDLLTYQIENAPAHGTVTLTGNQATYQPQPNYNGTDSFSFSARDTQGAVSNTAVISLNIAAVNDAPVAYAQSVPVVEDTPEQITLIGSDPDGDMLTYEIVREPSFGTLSGTAPDLVYTPYPDSNAPDSFSYIVSDGNTSSPEANVTITIEPRNDAPEAVANAVTDTVSGKDITVAQGTVISLDATQSSDPEDAPAALSFLWYEGTNLLGSGATLDIDTFTPGVHLITLIVTDSDGVSAQDSLTVTVTQVATFQKLSPVTVGTSMHQLFVKDIDNDNKADIIIATGDVDNSTIQWYKNEGNLTFSSTPAEIAANIPLQVMVVEDIDADGVADVIFGKDAITICDNDTAGNFNCSYDALYSGMWKDDNIQAMAVADVDNQNGVDLIVANSAMAEYEVIVYLKDSTQTCSRTNDTLTVKSSIYNVTGLSVADNDNDGDADLLVSTADGTRYYQNNINQSNNFLETVIDDISSAGVYFSDIDGDQKLDMVSLYDANQTLAWQSLANSVEVNTTLQGYHPDIDLDGNTDMIGSFNMAADVSWWKNSGADENYALISQIIETVPTGSEVIVSKGADLDGDGDIDIVTVNSAGEIVIYENLLK